MVPGPAILYRGSVLVGVDISLRLRNIRVPCEVLMNEAKRYFTELAKKKAAQTGHNKQMYWDDGKKQYFVEAYKDGRVTYSKA